MSFGLTQYDMEELMTFTNHQCARLPYLSRPPCSIHGLASDQTYACEQLTRTRSRHCTQDFALLIEGARYGRHWVRHYAVHPKLLELELDDARVQGYVSSDELLNIPELSINPLARRLERLFDSINFKVLFSDDDHRRMQSLNKLCRCSKCDAGVCWPVGSIQPEGRTHRETAVPVHGS